MATDDRIIHEIKPNKWIFGLIYRDPEDPRILVPQRPPGVGWTLNFGRPVSWVIAAGLFFLIIRRSRRATRDDSSESTPGA